MLLQISYNTYRVDISGNSKFLSKLLSHGLLQRLGLATKNRGIRQRCIFEITRYNIRYYKDMKISDIRYLDGNEAITL